MASLDTSILVDVLRRRSRFHRLALAKLDELQARGETLATTRFTVAELYVGIELSDNAERDQAAVDMLLADLEILDFGVTVATSASCVGWYPESVGFRGFHRHDEGCEDGEVTRCGEGAILAGGDPAV